MNVHTEEAANAAQVCSSAAANVSKKRHTCTHSGSMHQEKYAGNECTGVNAALTKHHIMCLSALPALTS